TRVFAAKIGLLADRRIDIEEVRARTTPSAMKTILAQSLERSTGETLAADDPRLEKLAMVLSQVIGSDGRPKADVQWLVELSNEEPRVFDVVAEGTSSLIVEREKIKSIAAREGLDALLLAMEKQIEDERDT
ncbi:MAG: ABC transporter substrate-binding protein, partial [Caulobacterales bacterium]|nr:ABC transporter substrate-binding protein [Caulobacterales bacterium]